MFSPDVLVAQPLGFFRRIGQHALALVRKRQVDRGGNLLANRGVRLNLLADRLHRSVRAQKAVGQGFVLAQQAEQQVLGLDIGRAELAGLVSREEDHAPCLLRIAFEHDVLPPDPGLSRLSAGVAVRFNCRPQPNPRVPFFNFAAEGPRKMRSCPEQLFGWCEPFALLLVPGAIAACRDFHPALFSLENRPASRLLTLRLKNTGTVLFHSKACALQSTFETLPGCKSFAIGRQLSAFQAQRPRTARGQVKVMRHQNRGEAVARVQPFDQVKDAAGGDFVQVAGGLVGQQQAGIVHQRASQRHALLLAAGELAGAMIGAIFQANLLEPVCRHGAAPLVSVPRASSGMATFSSAVNSGSR
jgi:hypothetical protein